MNLLLKIPCFLFLFLSVSLFSYGQESHSDPYIVDFESDYGWNPSRPHYPRCWVIWNGMNSNTGDAANGNRYIGQTSGQPKVQVFSCYFYATTADTFSFYYRLRRSAVASTDINDFTPYVGYFRYGDMDPVGEAIWMDTLTFAAGNIWYHYSANFQYDGYQKVVIYADNDYFFNWLNDSETGFSLDYFRTSGTPSYDAGPKISIRLKSGTPTACQNETRTYVADTLMHYANPPYFNLQWRVNGVLRKTSSNPADSLFEYTSNTLDTVIASLLGFEFCHSNTNPTSVTVRDTLHIGECREINMTSKNKTGVCPEETVRFNFSASPSDNWPDGNSTQISAQISALGTPDWSAPDVLTGGSVNLDAGSITGAFPAGKTPGKYYIRLIANDPLQTPSLNYDSVDLYALPDTSLIDANDVTTCLGDSTYITIQNTQVDVRYILSSGVTPVDTIFGDGTNQALRVWAPSSTTLRINATNTSTGCASNASKDIQVTVVDNPSVTHRDYTMYCTEDTLVEVNVSGGTPPYSFSWESDSLVPGQNTLAIPRTLQLVASQIINVTVTDANNCEEASYVDLDIIGYPLVIDANDVTTCQGDSTLISIQNTGVDVRYIISSGMTTLDTIYGDGTNHLRKLWIPSSTTLHINATTLGTHCPSSESKDIQVNVVEKPTISERSYIVYYEEDTIIGISLSGGTPPYVYSWEPDSLVAGQENLPNPRTLPLHISQNIYVTVTDNNSCEVSSYAYLNVKGSPLQVVIESDENSPNPNAGQALETPYDMTGHSNSTTMCQGDSIYLSAMVFGGSENYTLEWRKIEESTTLITGEPHILVISPPVPSQYVLIVDDGDIEVTDTFYVQQVFEVAPALAEPDTFLFPNAHLQLHGTLLPPGNPLTASYRWEPAEFLDNPDIPDPTVIIGEESVDFVLTVTDINGCKSRDTASIRFRAFEVYVPSAFTPNTDDTNDSIAVRGFGINEILFRIYNRWGELVFETDQWYPEEYRSSAWDGVYKGVLQHTQTFGYFLRAKTLAGDTYEETGTITILK
jgi:gliding motility-associated-like protein